jgi:hypothetical protein
MGLVPDNRANFYRLLQLIFDAHPRRNKVRQVVVVEPEADVVNQLCAQWKLYPTRS